MVNHNHQPFYDQVGRLIKSAREAQEFTQETLAKRVGLTRTSVTNIEKGRQKLLLHKFMQIAEALGKTPTELLPIGQRAAKEPDEALNQLPADQQKWIRSALKDKDEPHARTS